MSARIGRNRNMNDIAVSIAGVTINSSTSVLIAAANPNRIYFHVNNDSSPKDSWIKLQPSSTDNDKKGIFLSGSSSWEMQPDNIYTGEISAIRNKTTSTLYIKEY